MCVDALICGANFFTATSLAHRIQDSKLENMYPSHCNDRGCAPFLAATMGIDFQSIFRLIFAQLPIFETFVLNEEPSYSNIPGLYRHQKKPLVPIEPSDMVVGDGVVENSTVEISKKQGNRDFSSF